MSVVDDDFDNDYDDNYDEPAMPCAHTNGTVIIPGSKPNRLIIGKINEGSLMFEETQVIELREDLEMSESVFHTAFNSDGTQFATADSDCLSILILIHDHD